MLDHTMVVWGSEIADGNSHEMNNMPFVVAGGGAYGVRTGRFLNFNGAIHQRLLVSMAHYMGLTTIQKVGDLDTGSGPLPGLLA